MQIMAFVKCEEIGENSFNLNKFWKAEGGVISFYGFSVAFSWNSLIRRFLKARYKILN